ncbi:MAG: serine hydrolase [Myxococcota bacterium]
MKPVVSLLAAVSVLATALALLQPSLPQPIAVSANTSGLRQDVLRSVRQQVTGTLVTAPAHQQVTEPAAVIESPLPPPVVDGEPPSLPAWTPPSWFPEGAGDALWVLDGIDSPAEVKDRIRGLKSRTAFVYDLDAGRVLLAYGADERRPVASLTKMISALALVSEPDALEREVCLGLTALPDWPGAGSHLRYGRCTTGWDLLGAALVRSDNGAAMAMPSAARLPEAPFIARMNVISRELGMNQSSFVDPSGIFDDNLSTARDMTRAVIAVAHHPELAPVASAPYWRVEYHSGRTKKMRSTNRLLGMRGVEFLAAKTGYTDTARHCFAAVVRTASGRRLAFTTLGARRGRYRWSDAKTLLKWAENR